MRKTIHPLPFRRRTRRGSILILVVAVLVLLALMGTAYMSVARIDRLASGPLNDATPAEVLEQLVPAVKTMVNDTIVKDVNITPTGATLPNYRPVDDLKYDNWDYAGSSWIGNDNQLSLQNDSYLASRLPNLMAATNVTGKTEIPVWNSVSRAVNQPDFSGPGTPTMVRFETPLAFTLSAAQRADYLEQYPEYTPDQNAANASDNLLMAPTQLTITYPATHPDPALVGKTRVYPAFMAYDLKSQAVGMNPVNTAQPMKFLAADADGDGIADSGLVYLTTVDGIRYYYATRTVDNGSAVNVNTARSMFGDFAPGATTVNRESLWMFPSNVGLLELLLGPGVSPFSTTSPEMDRINMSLWNTTTMPNPLTPVLDYQDPNGTDAPATGAPPTHPGYTAYATQGEANYFALGMRPDNPGFRESTAPATPDLRMYNPFKPELNQDLAYRFGMMNPNDLIPPVTSADGVMAYAPRVQDTYYAGAPNYALVDLASGNDFRDWRFKFFPSNQLDYWFQYSYNWDLPNTRTTYFGGSVPEQSIRSILTAHNPVSNRTPGLTQTIHASMLPYGHRGRWNDAAIYAAGDICYYTVPAADPVLPQTYLFLAMTAVGPSATTPQPAVGGAANGPWVRLNPRGMWNTGAAYVVGDMVHARISGTVEAPNWSQFVATAPSTGSVPAIGALTPWKPFNVYITPPRASLNTAPFEELFRAFFNVMSEGNTSGPPIAFSTAMTAFPPGERSHNGTLADGTNNPYVGSRFLPQGVATPQHPFDGVDSGDAQAATIPEVATGGVNALIHPHRMFRSPLRSPPSYTTAGVPFDASTRRLTVQSVMQLRAAIAAVNAVDARDRDVDVTARKVGLQMVQGPGVTEGTDFVSVEATVFGQEPQPFITEVYASSDVAANGGLTNPQGYVAIELHNPYPIDIPLTNWKLAILNRIATDGTTPGSETTAPRDLAVRQLVDFGVAGTAPVVPAQGYLLLENYDSSGTSPDVQKATYRPPSTGLPVTGIITGSQPGTTPAPSGPPPVMPQLNVAYLSLPQITPGDPKNKQASVFNQEMVLLKPRKFDGTYTSAAEGEALGLGLAGGPNLYSDDPLANANYLRDMVPIDSFDFTGLVLPITGHLYPDSTAPQAQVWHYMRASNTNAATPPVTAWHFVHPGRYDASNSVITTATSWNTARRPRQAGTYHSAFFSPPASTDPWAVAINRPFVPGREMTLGQTFGGPVAASSPASPRANYHTTFPIQLANGNFHDVLTAPAPVPGGPGASIGHNPVTAAGGYAFPFGGFSRNGDVLHVPFIGSYVIKINDTGASAHPATPPDLTGATPALLGGTYVVEMNPVAMDAAMSEDTDTANDPLYADVTGMPMEMGTLTEVQKEHVGRFVPTLINPPVGAVDPYGWTSDVFDYFTAIQNVHDDFLPNANPGSTNAGTAPRGVANINGVLANTDQDFDAGVHGLININTASWKVLSTLPLVVDAAGNTIVGSGMSGDPTNLNERMAKIIAYYRDVDDGTGKPHGPFKNLFELNWVFDSSPGGNALEGFRNMMLELDFSGAGSVTAANDPSDQRGDFTPMGPATGTQPGTSNGVVSGRQTGADGVRLDYEELNLNLIRLSNLLTTRSDVFTTYVLVQGWKNAGTEHPQLVAEKRAAFMTDRSKIYSEKATLESHEVPTK